MDKYYRGYVKVDLGCIRYNLEQVRNRVGDDTHVMAIIKADGYGHGAVKVRENIDDLVDAYGVATIEEAISLRENGTDKMILILGYTPESAYDELIKYQISQTIFDVDSAQKLSKRAVELKKTAKIHIKIDTGMSRIGFKPTLKSVEEIAKISTLEGLELEGCFTHFARADEETIEPAKEPFAQYCFVINELKKRNVEIPVKHVSNSAAIMAFDEAYLTMVRSGIITYGIYPSDEIDHSLLSLKPAMEWKSVVSFVKTIEQGTPVSYGGTFVAKKKMRIATVPMGYADGMKRCLSGKGHVLIGGKEAPILGRICMDQFMVDVSDIQDVKVGDEVTIFGKDGDKEITIEEISTMAHSFPYEFICGITNRVTRKYV